MMQKELIAPCGMNCAICMAYLRENNVCHGCRLLEKSCKTRVNCRIRNCPELKKQKSGFCYTCEKYPCARIKQLDKRYRTKYNMSMLDNLEYINTKGMKEFLKGQEKKYRCGKCGWIVCVHNGKCYNCLKKILKG